MTSIAGAELFARLEQRTTALNKTSFAADFHTLSQSAEVVANPELAFCLGMENACQMTWLNESCVRYGGTWKNPAQAAGYFRARKAETQNELLQLRYGLIWLLTLPRGRHTVELAKEVVAGIWGWLQRDQGRHEATEGTYNELVQLGLLLSRQYHCTPEKMRRMVLAHLLDGQQSVVLRWWQLQFFGRRADLFTPAECATLETVSQSVHDHYKAEDRHMVKMVCEAAIPLAARATNDARRWHSLKGDYIKDYAEQRYAQDPDDFVVQVLLTDALQCYRAAADRQQVQAIEALISATKHQVRLHKVTQNLTLDGPQGELIAAWVRELPTWILAEDGHLIFWRMRYNLLPSRPTTVSRVFKPELIDIFRYTAFDRNNNLTTRQQKNGQAGPFNPYSLSLTLYLHMTNEVFAQGLQSGKLTYATTLEFLREQTWLGQVIFEPGLAVDSVDYTLVSWVEPALRNYFREVERAQNEEAYTPELMLCLDSLTMKIEGLIRHFCRLAEPPVPTNYTSANGDQQEFTLEKIIASVEEYSGVDAGYWLRFVLTKEGLNVRNDVAHGFLGPRDYSLLKMQLVLELLLIKNQALV